MAADNVITTAKPRLAYLDILRGFCMIWVVWIHIDHPSFADYPFRLAAMFFISGTLFKERSWNGFWRKKTNQIFVPFAFFYLIYYVFLLGLNLLKYHSFPVDIAKHITDVFGLYTGNQGFVINYPLWFILALFWHQFLMQTITKLTSNVWYKVIAIVGITVAGYLWIQWVPTPFMIGRASTYFIFYGLGCVLSNLTKSTICTTQGLKYFPLFFIAWLAMLLVRYHFFGLGVSTYGGLIRYVELLLLCYTLLQVAFYFEHSKAVKWLGYFGRNSIILYGFHDMILSVLHIGIERFVGPMSITLGFVCVALTLLISVPLIKFLTKYFPTMVAKKPLIAEV